MSFRQIRSQRYAFTARYAKFTLYTRTLNRTNLRNKFRGNLTGMLRIQKLRRIQGSAYPSRRTATTATLQFIIQIFTSAAAGHRLRTIVPVRHGRE